jgi:hypothetical protein
MPEKGLTAMATLDYDVIQKNWQSTMPNRDLLKDLLKLTDGRFIVSNEKNLFLDKDKNRALTDEITELKSNWNDAQKDDFSKRYHKTNLYIEYHLDGK